MQWIGQIVALKLMKVKFKVKKVIAGSLELFCPSVFFVSHEQTSENEEKSVRVLGKNDWGDYFYFSAMIVYRDGIK